MIRFRNLIIYFFLLGFFIAIRLLFANPYPCTASCISCSSIGEMFADTWSEWVSTFGVIFATIWFVFSNHEVTE